MKKFVVPFKNKVDPPTPMPERTILRPTPTPDPPKKEESVKNEEKPIVKRTPFKSPILTKKPENLPTKDLPVSKNSFSTPIEEVKTQYFTCMHTKRSNKKHKTYEDGIFVVHSNKYVLLDTNGKTIYSKTESKTIPKWKEGEGFELGGRELEIVKPIPAQDFISGKCFFQQNDSLTSTSKPIKVKQTQFKKPIGGAEIEVLREFKVEDTPKDAFILNEGHPEKDRNGNLIHDVYIDPRLSKILRDYQKEGVKFMYDCVMGVKNYQGNGCLLADDMGLGKSLQSVALIWTLLKRGPLGSPEVKKVMIVTNSSIVKNWKNEFKRWLGDERCKPLVVSAKTTKVSPADVITEWKNGRQPVIIISYDLCIRNADLLAECKCDLLVCDEGHKLKNKNIKIFGVLRGLTRRKIILSGTPLQNQLSEFFAIVDFINPGLLVNGDQNSFNNLFAVPISRSREPGASKDEKELGNERSKALNLLTSLFIIRRTREKLTALLPTRYEMVLFVTLSDLQKELYTHVVKSKHMNKIMSEEKSFSNALSMIQNMKRLLTHPNMVYNNIKEVEDSNELDVIWTDAHKLFPKGYDPLKAPLDVSNKMYLLAEIAKATKKAGDRIVIVSNFTTILDQIEIMLNKMDLSFERLDGSTNTSKRQDMIDKYNKDTCETFAFLLSAKAGGYGINLIGANRLVLFDPDWNPSVDLQAMSRVYREGQQKKVYIYRMVAAGTIEEKIYQRQIVKTALSKTVVDEKKSKAIFTKEMLKELFKFNEVNICETYKSEENDDYMSKIKADRVLTGVISSHPELIQFVKHIEDENIPQIVEDVEDSGAESEESTDSEEEEYNFETIPNKKQKLDDSSE